MGGMGGRLTVGSNSGQWTADRLGDGLDGFLPLLATALLLITPVLLQSL